MNLNVDDVLHFDQKEGQNSPFLSESLSVGSSGQVGFKPNLEQKTVEINFSPPRPLVKAEKKGNSVLVEKSWALGNSSFTKKEGLYGEGGKTYQLKTDSGTIIKLVKENGDLSSVNIKLADGNPVRIPTKGGKVNTYTNSDGSKHEHQEWRLPDGNVLTRDKLGSRITHTLVAATGETLVFDEGSDGSLQGGYYKDAKGRSKTIPPEAYKTSYTDGNGNLHHHTRWVTRQGVMTEETNETTGRTKLTSIRGEEVIQIEVYPDGSLVDTGYFNDNGVITIKREDDATLYISGNDSNNSATINNINQTQWITGRSLEKALLSSEGKPSPILQRAMEASWKALTPEQRSRFRPAYEASNFDIPKTTLNEEFFRTWNSLTPHQKLKWRSTYMNLGFSVPPPDEEESELSKQSSKELPLTGLSGCCGDIRPDEVSGIIDDSRSEIILPPPSPLIEIMGKVAANSPNPETPSKQGEITRTLNEVFSHVRLAETELEIKKAVGHWGRKVKISEETTEDTNTALGDLLRLASPGNLLRTVLATELNYDVVADKVLDYTVQLEVLEAISGIVKPMKIYYDVTANHQAFFNHKNELQAQADELETQIYNAKWPDWWDHKDIYRNPKKVAEIRERKRKLQAERATVMENLKHVTTQLAIFQEYSEKKALVEPRFQNELVNLGKYYPWLNKIFSDKQVKSDLQRMIKKLETYHNKLIDDQASKNSGLKKVVTEQFQRLADGLITAAAAAGMKDIAAQSDQSHSLNKVLVGGNQQKDLENKLSLLQRVIQIKEIELDYLDEALQKALLEEGKEVRERRQDEAELRDKLIKSYSKYIKIFETCQQKCSYIDDDLIAIRESFQFQADRTFELASELDYAQKLDDAIRRSGGRSANILAVIRESKKERDVLEIKEREIKGQLYQLAGTYVEAKQAIHTIEKGMTRLQASDDQDSNQIDELKSWKKELLEAWNNWRKDERIFLDHHMDRGLGRVLAHRYAQEQVNGKSLIYRRDNAASSIIKNSASMAELPPIELAQSVVPTEFYMAHWDLQALSNVFEEKGSNIDRLKGQLLQTESHYKRAQALFEIGTPIPKNIETLLDERATIEQRVKGASVALAKHDAEISGRIEYSAKRGNPKSHNRIPKNKQKRRDLLAALEHAKTQMAAWQARLNIATLQRMLPTLYENGILGQSSADNKHAEANESRIERLEQFLDQVDTLYQQVVRLTNWIRSYSKGDRVTHMAIYTSLSRTATGDEDDRWSTFMTTMRSRFKNAVNAAERALLNAQSEAEEAGQRARKIRGIRGTRRPRLAEEWREKRAHAKSLKGPLEIAKRELSLFEAFNLKKILKDYPSLKQEVQREMTILKDLDDALTQAEAERQVLISQRRRASHYAENHRGYMEVIKAVKEAEAILAKLNTELDQENLEIENTKMEMRNVRAAARVTHQLMESLREHVAVDQEASVQYLIYDDFESDELSDYSDWSYRGSQDENQAAFNQYRLAAVGQNKDNEYLVIQGDGYKSMQGMEKTVSLADWAGGPLNLALKWKAMAYGNPLFANLALQVIDDDSDDVLYEDVLREGMCDMALLNDWTDYQKDVGSYVQAARKIRLFLYSRDEWGVEHNGRKKRLRVANYFDDIRLSIHPQQELVKTMPQAKAGEMLRKKLLALLNTVDVGDKANHQLVKTISTFRKSIENWKMTNGESHIDAFFSQLTQQSDRQWKELTGHYNSLYDRIEKRRVYASQLQNADKLVKALVGDLDIYRQIYLPLAQSPNTASVFAELVLMVSQSKDYVMQLQPRTAITHTLSALANNDSDMMDRSEDEAETIREYVHQFGGYQNLKGGILKVIESPYSRKSIVKVDHKAYGFVLGGIQDIRHRLFTYGKKIDIGAVTAGLGALLLSEFGRIGYFRVNRVAQKKHPYLPQITRVEKKLAAYEAAKKVGYLFEERFDNGLNGWEYQGSYYVDNIGSVADLHNGYTLVHDGGQAMLTRSENPLKKGSQAWLEKIVDVSHYLEGSLILSFDWKSSHPRINRTLTTWVRVFDPDSGALLHFEMLEPSSNENDNWQHYKRDLVEGENQIRKFRKTKRLRLELGLKATVEGPETIQTRFNSIRLQGLMRTSSSNIDPKTLKANRTDLILKSHYWKWHIKLADQLSHDEKLWLKELFKDVGFPQFEGSECSFDHYELRPSGGLNLLDEENFRFKAVVSEREDSREPNQKFESLMIGLKEESGISGLNARVKELELEFDLFLKGVDAGEKVLTEEEKDLISSDFSIGLGKWRYYGRPHNSKEWQVGLDNGYTLEVNDGAAEIKGNGDVVGTGQGIGQEIRLSTDEKNGLTLSFDWQSQATIPNASDVYLQIFDTLTGESLYHERIGNGEVDSGWQNYSKDLLPYIGQERFQLRILLFSIDKWEEDAKQIIRFRNIQLELLQPQSLQRIQEQLKEHLKKKLERPKATTSANNTELLRDTFSTGLDGWNYVGTAGSAYKLIATQGVAQITGDASSSWQGLEKKVDLTQATNSNLILSFDWQSEAKYGVHNNAYLEIYDAESDQKLYLETLYDGNQHIRKTSRKTVNNSVRNTAWKHYSKDLKKTIGVRKKIRIVLASNDRSRDDSKQILRVDNIHLLSTDLPAKIETAKADYERVANMDRYIMKTLRTMGMGGKKSSHVYRYQKFRNWIEKLEDLQPFMEEVNEAKENLDQLINKVIKVYRPALDGISKFRNKLIHYSSGLSYTNLDHAYKAILKDRLDS